MNGPCGEEAIALPYRANWFIRAPGRAIHSYCTGISDKAGIYCYPWRLLFRSIFCYTLKNETAQPCHSELVFSMTKFIKQLILDLLLQTANQ